MEGDAGGEVRCRRPSPPVAGPRSAAGSASPSPSGTNLRPTWVEP